LIFLALDLGIFITLVSATNSIELSEIRESLLLSYLLPLPSPIVKKIVSLFL